MGRKTQTSSPSMQRIVKMLELHGPMDPEELSEYAHVTVNTLTAGGYLVALRNEELVHVLKWNRNYPGMATPIYKAGPGINAPKPRKISVPERGRRYRRRIGNDSVAKRLNDLLRG